jgi:PAS domain S-box-containing protein
MTKLDLTVSTASFECISLDDEASALLGATIGSSLWSLLADENEIATFKDTIQDLIDRRQNGAKDGGAFATIDLVFRCPDGGSSQNGASTSDSAATTKTSLVDRSPLQGVFRSPIRAIHTSGVTELSCFTHIQFVRQDTIHITAIEFSREYREQKLRQEFGSWLLEDHIESAAIATDPLGTVVFWNRFASELYQYTKEEAMGRNIMELTPSEMTQEQGMEIFSLLLRGEHWKGFFGVKRKDGHRFIAHVTDTPVLNRENELKFIVGVSGDYTQMHDLMEKLTNLNTNLEAEVVARTETIFAQEKSLRMVGTAVQESDTGVVITDHNFRIVWYNQAVTKFTLNNTDIMNEYPWDLPLDFQLESGEHERDDPENHRVVQSARQFFESGNLSTIPATVRT